MYRTCLYCAHDLGDNDAIELLPIGRRIAFDSSAGRLWVICHGCARWNLVPFDTRLETIDACERLFHDARKQFSTGHIGLARVGEGVELVRIGPALRPEFAAWRYGDRFASRRRRNIAIAAVGGVAVLGAYAGLHVLMGVTAGGQFLFQGANAVVRRRIVARFVPEGEDEALTLSAHDVRQARIAYRGAQGWVLTVRERHRAKSKWLPRSESHSTIDFTTEQLPNALSHMLPGIAGLAGTRKHVAAAASMVEEHHTVEGQLNHTIVSSRTLLKLGAEQRLALEMVANESSERRYLEGELKLLERQWRQADELARIADSLAVTEQAEEAFAARRSESPD